MQARLFDSVTETCNLCSRHCRIPRGKRGFCNVRENVAGNLVTLTYGKITACGIDPVEKKPLYHFLPGTGTVSVSSFGCNFTCRHCQNHTLSQEFRHDTERAEPEDIVWAAVRTGAQSISFTYNEPTVFYEFMYDVSREAQREGLRTAVITNGYMTEDAVREIAPYVDAFRIDLKAFSDSFYRTVCGGAHLQPVLDTISSVSELQKHLELVTLIIPGINDAPEEISADFALRCKGDSMAPRLLDGDLVFIKQQPSVDNGEIAAVIIGEALFGKIFKNFALRLLSVAFGSIIYYIVVQAVITMGLDANLLKLLSAVIVAIFLAIPHWKRQYKEKHMRKQKGGKGNA